ncbi:hypothetical protein SH139x_000214 [Planctomycetaceae bacterium SH139]
MNTYSDTTTLYDSKEYTDKLEKRQIEWQWNRPLLLSTLAFVLFVALGSFVSYRYHTGEISRTYFARAQAAAEAGDLAEQAKWLQRYLLIEPGDLDAVVTVAIAADEAAEAAVPAQRFEAIERARRLLSSSIARLNPQDRDQSNELRRRLIKRLLQLGGAWYREAERQVVSLAAETTEPQANRWMAEALVGQVRLARYDLRIADKYDAENDYWNWLSHQQPGEVLIEAIKLNPGEPALIGSLVELFQASPEMFDQIDGDAGQRDAALAARVESLFSGVVANTDSRSLLIRYRFYQERGQAEKAAQILLPAAKEASARLAAAAAEPNNQPVGPVTDQADAQTWDYILLAEAARQISESDPQQAKAHYEQLMAYRPSSLPANVAESVYLLAGQLLLQQGDADSATEVWKQGLDFSPNNLDLLGSLARLQVYQLQTEPGLLDPAQYTSVLSDEETSEQLPKVDLASATATLRQFKEAIETLSNRLIQTSEAALPREARLALGRRIETARWRSQVLQAALAILDDRPREAIANLREAITSTAEVEVSERIVATLQLASLYQNEGSWDQAGMMLNEAIKLSPENAALRARAANAWARAGDQNQSLQQWRMAGNSNSLGIQVASMEALLNDQLRLPPAQQDFSGLRVAIRNARSQHAGAIEKFMATSKQLRGETNEETPQVDQGLLDPETRQAIAQLEIVTVLLPPTGMHAEQYWQSADFAASLAVLAEQHPDELSIQAFAAERFAMLGRKDESKQALAQLDSQLGPNSMTSAIVQARIQASQGDANGAAKGLLAYAESKVDSADKSETDEIFRLAGAYALSDSQPELAYQTMLRIPADRRSLTMEFLLARLAAQLPASSSIFQQAGAVGSPAELSAEWETQLKQREGESGSHWRFLKITRLIAQLRSENTSIKRDAPKLVEARQTLKELLTLRPRWGEAISLEGQLLAIEGQPERAVEFLRKGIAAGDRQMRTRAQLWQQLVLLGREAEVDDDIRATAAAAGQPLEQYASTRIQLAVRQGDYHWSVEVARQAAEQRPDDAAAQIVFARTAAMAARQPDLSEISGDLLQQARQAIDAAQQIDGANQSSVVSARMAVTIAAGDEAAIRAEIDQLKESTLPDFERWILASQALVAIKDYEAALPLLKQADQARPSSRTQLALAALYRELKRSEDEVAALRRAQQRDPDNAMLRNQLAQALVARDGGEIDWREIEQLLQNSAGVTAINRFLYAILLGTRGQIEQQEQAATILREIILERNARSDDAARVLAAIRRRQLEALIAAQLPTAGDNNANTSQENVAAEAKRLGDEARQLYDALSSKSPPAATDLYRYADFLLQLGDEKDHDKVAQLIELLKNSPQGTFVALDISIRFAKKTGRQETAPQIVDQWAERITTNGTIDDSNVASIAGASLVNLGFVEEGLRWFEQAYEQNAELLSNYVITLVQVERPDEAREVSANHYDKHQDAVSAMLLSELLLNHPEAESNQPYLQRIDQAVKKFDRNAPLLESVATLRMQQNDYLAAIALFQQAQTVEPLRVRILNNLAMSFSEVPGREAEGILPIQQAINLAGEIPELLDTKGVVLLKAGKLVEAEQVFRLAIEKQPEEPRFQFHLILTLIQQGKETEAKSEWLRLRHDKLDPSGLTLSERQILERLQGAYGT